MTRGDLIRHIGLEFGLDRTSGSDEQLLMVDWANAAVIDVLLETHCHVELGDQALTIGTSDYRIDATIMAVDDRTIQANVSPLQVISIEEMYDLRRGLAVSYPEVTRLAGQGDLLMVWPAPTAATTISYVYVAKPTAMSADANDPSASTYGGIPEEHHPCLLAYMRWRAALYDERRVPHTPNDYRTFYDQELARVKKHVRRHLGRPLRGAREPGYPGSLSIPRRNDVYPER